MMFTFKTQVCVSPAIVSVSATMFRLFCSFPERWPSEKPNPLKHKIQGLKTTLQRQDKKSPLCNSTKQRDAKKRHRKS